MEKFGKQGFSFSSLSSSLPSLLPSIHLLKWNSYVLGTVLGFGDTGWGPWEPFLGRKEGRRYGWGNIGAILEERSWERRGRKTIQNEQFVQMHTFVTELWYLGLNMAGGQGFRERGTHSKSREVCWSLVLSGLVARWRSLSCGHLHDTIRHTDSVGRKIFFSTLLGQCLEACKLNWQMTDQQVKKTRLNYIHTYWSS